MQKFSEYKVIEVFEGGCGTIFLGSSKIPLKKLEAELNRQTKDGWQVAFQVIEKKTSAFFWQRESIIITLGRQTV